MLAVGWKNGWGIFSVGGRCLACGLGIEDVVDEDKFQDAFMYGVKNLVSLVHTQGEMILMESWGSFGLLGTLSLWYWLSRHPKVSFISIARAGSLKSDLEVDGQLFVIPFAKSATTGQHSPVSSVYLGMW